jgi:hypothetical protein
MTNLELPEGWQHVSTASSQELVDAWKYSAAHGGGGVDLVAAAIARRPRSDDFLFTLTDGRLAQVHVTWTPETDPRWPFVEIYESAEEWRAALAAEQEEM